MKRLSKTVLKLRSKPWINSKIQKLMKIRDKLFKQFKFSKSPTDQMAHKQFRNRVVNEIRESKKNYHHNYFDENKSNMKMLWKGFKDIIHLKSQNRDTFSHLVDDDGLKITDPIIIANEFNGYFTKVAEEITKKDSKNPKIPIVLFTTSKPNFIFYLSMHS